MEIIENIALISINETLIFQLVSFLLFLFVFNRIMIRPIRETMAERDLFFEKIEQEISTAEKTYEDISQQIHKEEVLAKRSAFKVRDKLESEGMEEANKILEKTGDDIHAMRVKAEQDTDLKIKAARQGLQSEIETIADYMIGVLLERRSSS
jgi:F-type H+-transporting ATPase subunit b